jgi:signal transduction histidine kinase
MPESTVAPIPVRRSLRVRLLVLFALSTAVVVGGTTYVLKRIVVDAVEREALEAAGASALGVGAEIADRGDVPQEPDLGEMLADFARIVPDLRGLTVARREPDGRVAVLASTEDLAPPGLAELALQAIEGRERVASGPLPGHLRLVAVPLERDRRPYGAVVVSMSTEASEAVVARIRRTALVVTPLAILILTALLHALTRDLVVSPLEAIVAAMRRASEGDLEARVRAPRRDEIGAVASGLNAMLEQVRGFNAALQREVGRATAELEDRSRQLGESAQRLFAARRDLARSEQLAVAGRMAASVAHQIGTPLNLISGYVQMIQRDLPAESTAAERLRTVQEQIRRVTTIVQGLLDQSRRPVLHREEIPAEDLVRRVCELARPTLEAAHIRLETRVGPGRPLLDVDVGQLEQVFLNLITNSVDAMPGGGTLAVSAAVSGAWVELAVADSGSGIDAPDVGRVFDPFFTTKEPGRGTGLGLTIVRDVVAAHGGTVSLDSRPDAGTTVTLRLPRVPALEQKGA